MQSQPFYLLSLEGLSIFDQLQIEEALFRADDRNWCLVNHGTSPSIVMGISGKQEEHIHLKKMTEKPIPLIRRFSGGGTVIVDEHTLFYTLIGNRSFLDFSCSPHELMSWTEQIYAPAFQGIDFYLRDNDYVINNQKFGGNAQYISKNRWLHHSSLLWDYKQEAMEYLLMPPKMPAYRNGREHSVFLCRLKDHFETASAFKAKMQQALEEKFFLVPASYSMVQDLLTQPHRRSTQKIHY